MEATKCTTPIAFSRSGVRLYRYALAYRPEFGTVSEPDILEVHDAVMDARLGDVVDRVSHTARQREPPIIVRENQELRRSVPFAFPVRHSYASQIRPGIRGQDERTRP